MTGPASPGSWQRQLASLRDPMLTAVLTVQCSLDWLLPESVTLRDEIDEAITALALANRNVRIDRIVLHNVPAVHNLPSEVTAAQSSAHADWIYRLAAVGDLITATARPRVHRLILESGRHPNVTLMDGIDLQIRGSWKHPDVAATALNLVRVGATTPLTSDDVGRDGPFGDSDPSVYL